MENYIETFVNTYNNYLTLEMNKFDDVKLIIKADYEGDKTAIEYFRNGFEFPVKYGFVDFTLTFSEMDFNHQYYHFANHNNYNLFYVLNRQSGGVYLLNLSGEIKMCCGIDVESFFRSMIIVIEAEIQKSTLGVYELDSSIVDKYFKECLALNNNDPSVSEFYDLILCV
ncbi:hypothetical protein [Flammeovirga sp. OC4]|uniref:hypothetical protein n=1 Tax=Flammeovirga sp. OC4 TaxID=1382345 RepID=UPI0005C62189|nr:hypothetical protein [Flammeovirga sp. OC4]